MSNIKYSPKINADVIVKALSSQKLNASKINPLKRCLILFGGISFINAFGDSTHQVFQQFLHACGITLHNSLYYILSTVVGFYLAKLLKDVTHPFKLF